MNDKITELRKQSGGLFHEGWFGSPGTIHFTESEFEKFAELLIKECVGLVNIYYGPYSIGEAIKKHFGVE
jgi:hypothetical protein